MQVLCSAVEEGCLFESVRVRYSPMIVRMSNCSVTLSQWNVYNVDSLHTKALECLNIRKPPDRQTSERSWQKTFSALKFSYSWIWAQTFAMLNLPAAKACKWIFFLCYSLPLLASVPLVHSSLPSESLQQLSVSNISVASTSRSAASSHHACNSLAVEPSEVPLGG